MIKSFNYKRLLPEVEGEILDAVLRVLYSGNLILGPETDAFESQFAEFLGVRAVVAVSSGTTAIHLALMALGIGPGDEVITVSNTCAPTIAGIRLVGAKPVFVDVREDDLMMDTEKLEQKINKKTRCILPVHLWGYSVNLEEVLNVSLKHGIEVIEDCAQAHGTLYQKKPVGTFGVMGCFSFYPTKNIGAYGDAGAIVTNDRQLANRLKRLRMYGYSGSTVSLEEGMNARINEIQAAILRVKLKVFPKWFERRLKIASVYNERIGNHKISKPITPTGCCPAYHQYVIRCRYRKQLMKWLKRNDIAFGIHYPTPVHLMPAYSYLGGPSLELPVTTKACSEILSIPIHESLTEEEALYVTESINQFNYGVDYN